MREPRQRLARLPLPRLPLQPEHWLLRLLAEWPTRRLSPLQYHLYWDRLGQRNLRRRWQWLLGEGSCSETLLLARGKAREQSILSGWHMDSTSTGDCRQCYGARDNGDDAERNVLRLLYHDGDNDFSDHVSVDSGSGGPGCELGICWLPSGG